MSVRGAAPGTASRKSSSVVVIAQNDIADLKVRKQSSNLLAQQLQQQLILQQQQLRSVRRDQVVCFNHFCARQHYICYSAYMLSPVRPSVCLSHGWISQKRLKLGSCNFHRAPGSPMTLVSAWLTSPRNSKGNVGSEGAK